VRTSNDSILVEGNHEQRINQNEIESRHFSGTYSLPSDVIGEEVECNLSSEGQLEIIAPRHLHQLMEGEGQAQEQVSPPRPHSSPSSMDMETVNHIPHHPPMTPMKHDREHHRHLMRTEEEVKVVCEFHRSGNNRKRDSVLHPNCSDRERLEAIFDEVLNLNEIKNLDLMPIWRCRDWSRGPCRPAPMRERLDRKKVVVEDLEDWADFKANLFKNR